MKVLSEIFFDDKSTTNIKFGSLPLNRSLDELVVDGIDTTKNLHKKIISSSSFKNYDFSINWLESFLKN